MHVEIVMGTAVSFDIRGEGDHAGALTAGITWLHEADRRFSPYLADSEVSMFDADASAASADLADIIAACDAVEAASGGAFSAHIENRFDPSAFVKGWSVDLVGRVLRAHGCEHWSVNAGGDVLVSSPAGVRAPWRVGVQHPFDRDALAFVLDAGDLAVATSGRYERGDHVMDPRTGAAATEVASTTVCGPDLGFADAFATAAFVLGVDGPAWIAQQPGYECWTGMHDGTVLATAGFPRLVHGVPVRFAPPSDLAWAHR